MQPVQLRLLLRPRTVGLILGGIALYLSLQSLIAEYLIENVLDDTANELVILVIDLFSVNAEQTIPTWYSVVLLLTAAVTLSLITIANVTTRQRNTLYWAGLSFIFFYLSMDEGAVIHEIGTDVIDAYFQVSGLLTFGWVIIAAPIVVLIGLIYLRFLLRLPARTRNQFILAGMVYVGGAIGVESISASLYDLGGGVSFEYLAVATIEETFEMLGVVIFIHGLLVYAANQRYSLLLEPRLAAAAASDLQTADLQADAADLSRTPVIIPRAMLIIPLLMVAFNTGLLVWAYTQAAPPTPPFEPPPEPPYLTLTDHLAAEGLVITRVNGRFGPENAPALQMAVTLLESFDNVMVITLISGEAVVDDFSLIAAAEMMPFNRNQLTDILHEYALTQFILFDTQAVRLLTRTRNADAPDD